MSAARAFLAGALGLPAESITGTARLGEPDAWDSIGHMRLVLALEERLGRPLSTEEMLGLETLGDLARLLDTA